MTDPPEALPECESKLVYSTMCEYDKEKIYYIVRRGRGKGTPSPKGVTLCCVRKYLRLLLFLGLVPMYRAQPYVFGPIKGQTGPDLGRLRGS